MTIVSFEDLRAIPHTPAGDIEFLKAISYYESRNSKYHRWLFQQALLRPAIYEEILLVQHKWRETMISITAKQSRHGGPVRD